MGEGLTPRKRNDTEIFERCCPYYLSIGMSSQEYWDGDADLPKFFREAFKLRQEQLNHEAWLKGLYVYDALCSALSHLNPKKDSHTQYAEKPYSFEAEKDDESKKIEAEAQAEVWMKSWASATQKMFKDK